MDGLIATLGVIAGVLAVIAGALPLYEAYRKRGKKRKDDNAPGASTDQAKLDQS